MKKLNKILACALTFVFVFLNVFVTVASASDDTASTPSIIKIPNPESFSDEKYQKAYDFGISDLIKVYGSDFREKNCAIFVREYTHSSYGNDYCVVCMHVFLTSDSGQLNIKMSYKQNGFSYYDVFGFSGYQNFDYCNQEWYGYNKTDEKLYHVSGNKQFYPHKYKEDNSNRIFHVNYIDGVFVYGNTSVTLPNGEKITSNEYSENLSDNDLFQITTYPTSLGINTDMSIEIPSKQGANDSNVLLDYLKIDVSLTKKGQQVLKELNERYSLERDDYYQFIPYISTSPPADGYNASFDNAIAVAYQECYYVDNYSNYENIEEVPGGTSASTHPDMCYGACPIYTLNPENNYTNSASFDLLETNLKKNKKYYLYVVSSLETNYEYLESYSNKYMPWRKGYTIHYNNNIGHNIGITGLDTFETKMGYGDYINGKYEKNAPNISLLSCIEFSLSDISKNRSQDLKYMVDGLMSTSKGGLMSNPKIVTPHADPTKVYTVDEIEKQNEERKEDYINSGTKDNFDITSIEGLLKSCSNFFDFLKKGFTIFPVPVISILIAGIAVLVFLRIIGR